MLRTITQENQESHYIQHFVMIIVTMAKSGLSLAQLLRAGEVHGPFVKLSNHRMLNSVVCHCFIPRVRLLSTDATLSFLNDLDQCHLIVFLELATDRGTKVNLGRLPPDQPSDLRSKKISDVKAWDSNNRKSQVLTVVL